MSIIYHGSNEKVEKPRIIHGQYTKDFGDAFYCTLLREQAIRWAQRKARSGYVGVLNEYNFNTNYKNLNVLKFNTTTVEWLRFIAQCRHGIVHNYDIVIGPMGDDQIYNYVEQYITGNMTEKQFLDLAKFKVPTQQIAFCTQRAIDQCIKYKTAKEV